MRSLRQEGAAAGSGGITGSGAGRALPGAAWAASASATRGGAERLRRDHREGAHLPVLGPLLLDADEALRELNLLADAHRLPEDLDPDRARVDAPLGARLAGRARRVRQAPRGASVVGAARVARGSARHAARSAKERVRGIETSAAQACGRRGSRARARPVTPGPSRRARPGFRPSEDARPRRADGSARARGGSHADRNRGRRRRGRAPRGICRPRPRSRSAV